MEEEKEDYLSGSLSHRRYRLDTQGQRLPVDDASDEFTCTCKKRTIIYMSLAVIIAGAVIVIVLLGIIYLQTIVAHQQNGQNVCIWNALNYSFVNGLYIANGKSKSGYPLYVKTEDSSCNVNKLYLFHSTNWVWSISTMPNNPNVTSVKGICASNTAENLTECRSLWHIPPNIPQKNVTVTVAQQCPEILCPQLSLYYNQFLPNEPCIGIFKRQETNLYQSQTDKNLYLYFNPSLFRWVCGDIDIMFLYTCDSLSMFKGYAIEQSWYKATSLMHNDDYINISWSNQYNLTMKCSNTFTRTPTKATISPTKLPTFEPTFNPTANPTQPTKSPSISPTKFPTKTPTAPTKSPTNRTTAPVDGGGCIASNSFVFTYPNYARKQINQLKIYDKILTYDELNDDYIWDELLVKRHFEKGEYMNNELVHMIEFKLENNITLTMTGNHLLYANNNGLKRADTVRIGDMLKQFDCDTGDLINVKVSEINENIMKYPRNLYTYNGNLVINGIAISQFTDRTWNIPLRYMLKHICSYNIYRNTVYVVTKFWNNFVSANFK